MKPFQVFLATAVVASAIAGIDAHPPIDNNGPPKCQLERGFDYDGFDIGNVANTPVDKCCDACTQVPGCVAFTWTDFNGGTCWLKNDRGRVRVNGAAISAVVSHDPNPACRRNGNVDIVGGDLDQVHDRPYEACCDICQNTAGCRAFSWNDYRNGTCYLKTEIAGQIFSEGASSSPVYPWPEWKRVPPICRLENNVNLAGHDIGQQASSHPGFCCSMCSRTPLCMAYTWNNYNGGTCYFKDGVGERQHKDGDVSAVVSENPGYQCKEHLFVDYDFADDNIGSAKSSNPMACCRFCMAKAGCTAYTWSHYEGGTCWLKKSTKGQKYAGDKISGVVAL